MFSNYCIFYNNTVGGNVYIYLEGNTGTSSRSNIIMNNSPSGGVIYVTGSGNYTLIECIFDQNRNILIYVDIGILKLINCYYLTGSSSSHGPINNSLIFSNTKTYTHSIYFIYFCSFTNQAI